jgi:hypothetical protein
MWKCYQNQVVVFYLPPHASHVLQPLDLTCFSLLKSRYRDQLTDLTRFDDSSAIKKSQFLKLYYKASKEGLGTTQIKAGWRAAGIHPWNPQKVIRSSQVLQCSQNPPQTPQTPQTPSRKRCHSDVPHTPHNKRDYLDSIHTILRQETISRPVRTFLTKVGKTIDRIEWQSTQKDLRLASQKAQLDELSARRQKRQAIDCNEVFASIETIQQAKQAVAAMAATRAMPRVPTSVNNPANGRPAAPPQDAFMTVFSINDVVE